MGYFSFVAPGLSGSRVHHRPAVKPILLHCTFKSFHITPEGRQPPPRHLQGRGLAKRGP
jgi:hypothetical protein